MADPPDTAYHHLPDWPRPGENQKPADLARLAVQWIAINQDFIRAHLPENDGFDHRDVISLLMFRAHRGGGLVLPLTKHANGTTPIGHPKGLLLQHAFWALGEYRAKPWSQREITTDWTRATAPPAALSITDPEDNSSGYLRLISLLTQECHNTLTAARPGAARRREEGRLRAVQHIQEHLPALWKIFCRYAPGTVIEAVGTWDEDCRACLLLAVFPARLPHEAVTTYRQLALTDAQGAITVSATQRKISRLRARLRQLWPPELAPPHIKSPGSKPPVDSGEEKAP